MSDSYLPPPPVRRWRGAVIALVAVGLLGAGAAAAAKFWLPGWLLSQAQHEASRRGVELNDCAIDYERGEGLSLRTLELRGCHLAMASPVAVQGRVERMLFTLERNQPRSVLLQGAALTVDGKVDVPALRSLADTFGRDPLEVLFEEGQVTWQLEPGKPPPVVATHLNRPTPQAPWTADVSLASMLDGKATVGDKISLDLHLKALPATRALAVIDPAKMSAHVSGQLARLPVRDVAKLLLPKVPPEIERVSVEGPFEIDMPLVPIPSALSGRFDFTVHGLSLSLPPEVKSLVNEQSPMLSSRFVSDRTYTHFELPDLKLQAGALQLTGTGHVERKGMDTRWQATMNGALSCQTVAASAASARLPPSLAEMVRVAAGFAVVGNVQLAATMDLDSRDIAHARFQKSVSGRCGVQAPIGDASIGVDVNELLGNLDQSG